MWWTYKEQKALCDYTRYHLTKENRRRRKAGDPPLEILHIPHTHYYFPVYPIVPPSVSSSSPAGSVHGAED